MGKAKWAKEQNLDVITKKIYNHRKDLTNE